MIPILSLDLQSYTQGEDDPLRGGQQERKRPDHSDKPVRGDAAGDVTYLSRADGFANYDEATAAPASDVMSDDLVAQYHLNSNFDYTTYINEDDEMPDYRRG